MPPNTDSKVQAATWIKPEQVQAMRNACYDVGADYLQQRNEAIIATLADSGLRVGELVALDVDHLRDGTSTIFLPGQLQKDYPNDNSPGSTRLSLSDDLSRLLSSYLTNRWKDSDALYPSRSSDRISEQGVRNAVSKVAEAAEIRPYRRDGTRGEVGDVTPHTLRHSVAFRMMAVEEGNTLYDVRKRLRHRSISTTEEIYDHFDEV